MRSSSGNINIAASAQKLDVDNRISLRFYYRISDNILKQASIFRGEGNIIDLYVMLLRFSSLVSETIPCHREYRASPQSYKTSLKKKLLIALSELEKLKPEVQKKIDELNRKQRYQADGWVPTKRQSTIPYGVVKTTQPTAYEYWYEDPRVHQFSLQKPVKEQFQRLSLSFAHPKEETLSRHSILGPNGLNGKWQQPSRSDKRIQYPSNIDFTPVEILRENSLQQPPENEVSIEKAFSNSTHGQESLGSDLPLTDDNKMQLPEEPSSLISFESIEVPPQPEIIRQPSPPPALADVQDLVPALHSVSEAEHGIENTSTDCLISPESPLELHFSSTLMDNFMKLAKSNTDKNLETCGVLAGLLKNRKFYVTALIIPKQESTSDSCQTTNEEELFEVQDKQSLFSLGWIHTHPTQSCFMSSIDLHTHYSYQMMLPESIAIVMAPQDSSRKHGIFRLTMPGGMTVIRQCPRRGFHAHEQPPDGGPLYTQCTDVYMNPSIKFDVIDLRR